MHLTGARELRYTCTAELTDVLARTMALRSTCATERNDRSEQLVAFGDQADHLQGGWSAGPASAGEWIGWLIELADWFDDWRIEWLSG